MTSTAARTLISMNTAENRTPHLTLAQTDSQDTLRNCVRRSLIEYFNNLEGEAVNDLLSLIHI